MCPASNTGVVMFTFLEETCMFQHSCDPCVLLALSRMSIVVIHYNYCKTKVSHLSRVSQ